MENSVTVRLSRMFIYKIWIKDFKDEIHYYVGECDFDKVN